MDNWQDKFMRATYHLILPDQVFGSSMFRKRNMHRKSSKKTDVRRKVGLLTTAGIKSSLWSYTLLGKTGVSGFDYGGQLNMESRLSLGQKDKA